MCLRLLIFPCTIKSRSSLLASAHTGGPGKKAIQWLCVCVGEQDYGPEKIKFWHVRVMVGTHGFASSDTVAEVCAV